MNLAKRSAPVDADKSDSTNSAIFGGAKPVDTSAKEREMEEKLQKQTVKTPRSRTTSERSNDSADNNKPSPFGGAKPVNTSKREREIEEKMSKVELNSEAGANNRRNNNQSRNNKGEATAAASEKKVRSPPPPKKVEEDKPPNFAGSNKYAFLPDEDGGAGSGKEDSD